MWLQECTFIWRYKISKRGLKGVVRRCWQRRFKDDTTPFVLQEAGGFVAANVIQRVSLNKKIDQEQYWIFLMHSASYIEFSIGFCIFIFYLILKQKCLRWKMSKLELNFQHLTLNSCWNTESWHTLRKLEEVLIQSL